MTQTPDATESDECQADAVARSLPELFATVETGLAHAEQALKDGKNVDLSAMLELITAFCAHLATVDKTIGRTYIAPVSRLVDTLNRLEADLAHAGAHSRQTASESADNTRFHQVYAAAAAQTVRKGR